MWAITPTTSLIYAYLSWAGFCLARIWFFPLHPWRFGWMIALPALVARRAFFAFYVFMGLFLLDLTIRFSFSGLISYGRFLNIAAPALLCATVGLLYLFRGVLLAPTWGELVAFSGMTGVYLYLTLASPDPPLRLALYAGIGLMFAVTPVEWFARRAAPGDAGAIVRPAWGLSPRMALFRGAMLYVVVLLLLSVELILELEGYTLFWWL
ncbi:MAG TPA: hypothetical protein PK379_05105 [Candidatus Hydrogenedentes bacterium]|nr:hypothetical protein [Candidatus Hydrogenedentota bacterium]HOK89382.1 hypothetical protein [Candidatus Hydrogenedentota bacterium]